MNLKNLLLIFFFFLFTFSLFAQVKDLPYTADWQEDEWTQYRLTPSTLFDWNIGTNAISHDYPVGNTNQDTIRDWLVSPAIDFFSTSKLSVRVRNFAIIGVTENDYFGVWFSAGSKNPNDGDYVEIAELTNFSVGQDWTDTTGIEIPFTANEGYIAFVYEAVNNWYTVAVDSLSIIPDSLPTSNQSVFLDEKIEVFPNPTSDFVTLSISKDVSINNSEVLVFNNLGQVVFSHSINSHQTILNFSAWCDGIYYYQLRHEGVVLGNGKVLLK